MFTLELSNIIFTVVNVLILYFLMRKFLIGPVRSIMEQRQQMIEGSFAEAQRKNDEANELKSQYEAKIVSAEDEAQQIVADAREKANDEYNRRVNSAINYSNRIRTEARERISAEEEQAKKDVLSSVASLAMAAAVKVAGGKNDALTDESIYDDFIREVSAQDGTTSY